jgi:hypothetical protein
MWCASWGEADRECAIMFSRSYQHRSCAHPFGIIVALTNSGILCSVVGDLRVKCRTGSMRYTSDGILCYDGVPTRLWRVGGWPSRV